MLTSHDNQTNTDSQRRTKEVEKILPEDTSIAMLWLVKESSVLEHDQLPLPNNQRFPYKKRLLNWADSEPQREIKLYYVSTDLTSEQVQEMSDLMNVEKGGRSNIKVVDFNDRFKDRYDLEFLKSEEIPFSWKVDIMRLIMLIEDGPAIYFDFDILPVAEQIGKISMNNTGYKMAPYMPWHSDDLENAITAVDSKNNFIVSAIYNTMKHLISNKEFQRNDEHLVWRCHLEAVTRVYNKVHNSEDLKQEKLEEELKEWLDGKEVQCIDSDERNKYFGCYGKFSIKRDMSWEKEQCDLYKQEKEIQGCITIVNNGDEEKLRLVVELDDRSIVVNSKNPKNKARYILYAEYNGNLYIVAGDSTPVKEVTQYAAFPIDFMGCRSANRIETSSELSKMKEMLHLNNGKRFVRVGNISNRHAIVSACDLDIYSIDDEQVLEQLQPKPEAETVVASNSTSDTRDKGAGTHPTKENSEQPPQEKVRFADDIEPKKKPSNPQTKPKNNRSYYIGGSATVGLAMGLIAAYFAGADIGVFIAAVVVGALFGAGVGYGVSRCLYNPKVGTLQPQEAQLPQSF